MKLLQCFLIVCIPQLTLGKESVFGSEIPSAEELEKKSVAYRLENIKQGNVRLRIVDDKPHTECLFDITFDEQRVRQIRKYRERGKPDWSGPEKIIITPDKYIADHEDTRTPVAVQLASVTDYKSPREHFGVLNIRALGMTPNGAAMLQVDDVESLMNRSDRTTPKVAKDTCGNIDTWRIDYEMKSPEKNAVTKVSLWVAPSQGFSVVGINLNTAQEGLRFATSISTQMKKYPENGAWYPYKLTKTLKVDDRLINRQEVIVEEARFGGPIDEASFSPAGLDLQPGRKVVDTASGASSLKVWDGKELTNASNVKTTPANTIPRRQIRWLQLSLAVGLGLLSIIYFWRVFRRRRSTTNPGA